MAASVAFDPPVTIEQCQSAGFFFGKARVELPRVLFERELTEQLTALANAIRLSELDQERAMAAFDQAAWDGWEGVSDETLSKPHRRWTRVFRGSA
jgi:hypothetical protein